MMPGVVKVKGPPDIGRARKSEAHIKPTEQQSGVLQANHRSRVSMVMKILASVCFEHARQRWQPHDGIIPSLVPPTAWLSGR